MLKNKIYITTILSLFLIFNSCSNDKTKIDKKPMLSECVIKSYDYKFGTPDTTTQKLESDTKYDSLGRAVKELSINLYRNNYIKTYYKYDTNGKLYSTIIYDDVGEPFERHIFYYDSNGRKIKEDAYTKKNKDNHTVDDLETTTFKYKDSLLVEEYKSPSNTRYTHIYDNNGHKQEDRTYYDNKNYPTWITKYKCDANGNVVYSENSYVGDKKLTMTRLYKYDNLNREIEEISLDAKDKQVFRTIYKYDKNNRKTESTTYGPMDEPVSLSKYNYIFK